MIVNLQLAFVRKHAHARTHTYRGGGGRGREHAHREKEDDRVPPGGMPAWLLTRLTAQGLFKASFFISASLGARGSAAACLAHLGISPGILRKALKFISSI